MLHHDDAIWRRNLNDVPMKPAPVSKFNELNVTKEAPSAQATVTSASNIQLPKKNVTFDTKAQSAVKVRFDCDALYEIDTEHIFFFKIYSHVKIKLY